MYILNYNIFYLSDGIQYTCLYNKLNIGKHNYLLYCLTATKTTINMHIPTKSLLFTTARFNWQFMIYLYTIQRAGCSVKKNTIYNVCFQYGNSFLLHYFVNKINYNPEIKGCVHLQLAMIIIKCSFVFYHINNILFSS